MDGPDDQERVLAMSVIEEIGSAAAPLAARIRPWTTVPFARIGEPARAALRAIEPR